MNDIEFFNLSKNYFKNAIESKGLPIHMSNKYCDAFTSKHNNCKGCESEEGCKRYAKCMTFIGRTIGKFGKNFIYDLKVKYRLNRIIKGKDNCDIFKGI